MPVCVFFFNSKPRLQEYPNWIQNVRLLNLTEIKKKGTHIHAFSLRIYTQDGFGYAVSRFRSVY